MVASISPLTVATPTSGVGAVRQVSRQVTVGVQCARADRRTLMWPSPHRPAVAGPGRCRRLARSAPDRPPPHGTPGRGPNRTAEPLRRRPARVPGPGGNQPAPWIGPPRPASRQGSRGGQVRPAARPVLPNHAHDGPVVRSSTCRRSAPSSPRIPPSGIGSPSRIPAGAGPARGRRGPDAGPSYVRAIRPVAGEHGNSRAAGPRFPGVRRTVVSAARSATSQVVAGDRPW
jgi:hypothetical protein